ncbi:MAG: gluconeogenesis factor YvcK family protein [Parashewanella sp.]
MVINKSKLPSNCAVVAIGGGHGLGQVLKSLSYLDSNLSAIVATSDNGGSSGKLRQINNNIAWGDIRNCLSQLTAEDSLTNELLEFRFKGSTGLGGHSIGNLLLNALEHLGKEPLEALELLRSMLGIKANIYPMSEQPTDLVAVTEQKTTIFGEVSIDASSSEINDLSLTPCVEAVAPAIDAISKADLIIIAPGSFYTSILPSLLIKQYQTAINNSKAKLIFIENITQENSIASHLTCEHKLNWIETKLNIRPFDLVIQHGDQLIFNDNRLTYPFKCKDSSSMHCEKSLADAISSCYSPLLSIA